MAEQYFSRHFSSSSKFVTSVFQIRPCDGLAVDFVVESDRAHLSEIVRRVRDGRLWPNIGNVSTLDDAVPAFNTTHGPLH